MKRQKSPKIAKAKDEFRIHLIIFVVINILLAVINLTFTPEYIWFKWPLLVWGIGKIFQAINIYSAGKTNLMEGFTEEEIQKENNLRGN